MNTLKTIAIKISGLGISDALPENDKRYVVLVNVISIFFILFVWSYFPLVKIFLPDNPALMWVLILHGLCFSIVPLLNYFGYWFAARISFGLLSAVFMCLESLLTGPDTYTHFFLMISPIVIFFIYPEREKWFQYAMAGFVTACFFGMNAWYLSHDSLYRIKDKDILAFLQWSVKGGLSLCLISVSVYAHSVIRRTEKLLYLEYRKADGLLRNILPDTIAERLKSGAGTIADGFAHVSVLFADIVNFTKLAESTSPEKLVVLLNTIFTGFDDCVEKHGLEKIKTIGDAYMIASGIPDPVDDHAQRIMKCAIDMISVIQEFNSCYGTSLSIRIGINSGPVIAGIIGKKKFIYDLWGDCVNVASRMESSGIAGRIQVTEATYILLRDRYTFEERGEIEVKGKGLMNVYLLAEQR